MSGKIYLIERDETLRALREESYDSEDLLQTLLANYPDVLAGDQVNEAAPRRWLLLSREVGVPDEAGGTNRWSLDHLFLDQEGIPTLVEVKRSTDTRIRREVAGQMLDYAANAVRYWPVEEIRAQYRAACEARGVDPARQIASLLEEPPDADAALNAFWQAVKTNLQAGRIRMVFVADGIPTELRRIVEFLNEQMDPAEVLAVEVKQYVGDELRTLVPTVVGQTAEAQQKKSATRPGKSWDEMRFFDTLRARHGEAAAEAGRMIYKWAQAHGCLIDWRPGDSQGGFMVRLKNGTQTHGLFKVGVDNTLVVYANHYNDRDSGDSVFTGEESWHRLRKKMTATGLSLPEDTEESQISRVPLEDLKDSERFDAFDDTFGWIVARLRSAASGNA